MESTGDRGKSNNDRPSADERSSFTLLSHPALDGFGTERTLWGQDTARTRSRAPTYLTLLPVDSHGSSRRFGVAMVLLLGCSPPATTGESNNARPDRNVITLPEIQAARTDNAYELVRTLHPLWLRKRGSNSMQYDGTIVVYLNETRLGGPTPCSRWRPSASHRSATTIRAPRTTSSGAGITTERYSFHSAGGPRPPG